MVEINREKIIYVSIYVMKFKLGIEKVFCWKIHLLEVQLIVMKVLMVEMDGENIIEKEKLRILKFPESFGRFVANTFFVKENQKIITCKSRDNATVIDHILIGKRV